MVSSWVAVIHGPGYDLMLEMSVTLMTLPILALISLALAWAFLLASAKASILAVDSSCFCLSELNKIVGVIDPDGLVVDM